MTQHLNCHQFNVGKIKSTLFKDYDFVYHLDSFFCSEDLPHVLNKLPVDTKQQNSIASPFVAILLETENSEKILIDTGVGNRNEPLNFKGQPVELDGSLLQQLDHAGIREQLDFVVLTHLHPDHAGGLFSEQGHFNFPNSQVIVHEYEWDYWLNQYPVGHSPFFDYMVEMQIKPLAQHNLKLVTGQEVQITPQIRIILAPGHTPGHCCVQVSSNGDHLLFISDTWLHPLHIESLDLRAAVDLDHELARNSRIRMLQLASDQSMLVQSFHFEFPGLGWIDRIGSKWKWITY